MSAPMVSNVSLSKRMFKHILLGNIILFFCIFFLMYLPLNGSSPFDLINNVLNAAKVNVSSVIALHVIFQICVSNLKGVKIKHGHVSKVLQDLFRCFVLFCSSVLVFHCVAVLFGAPFTERSAETFHFALVLSAATVVPALIHLGPSAESWIRVFAFNSPDLGLETMVYFTSICSLLGAWLGAFPIPLDWDRPWQVWPVSCLLGTIIGHCVGLQLTAIHLCLQYYRVNKSKLI